jgi:hypothetical protein
MTTLGRNFEIMTPSLTFQRGSRYLLDEGVDIPIGAPVEVADGADPSTDFTGALPTTLATGATAIPKKGLGGVANYEWVDLNQLDPEYFTYSDRGEVPDGKLHQVISGDGVRIMLRNTLDRDFLNSRTYAGRIMVAGLGGATPTLAVGDLLTPGTGDDDNGYWAETADAANAWLVIVNVDHDRSELEAELNF